MSSLEVGFMQTSALISGTQESQGTVLFKRPGRIRLDWKTAAGKNGEVRETFIIRKGVTAAWVYLPGTNQVSKVDNPFSSPAQYSQLVEIWFLESPQELSSRYDLRLVGKEKVDGGEVYRLELLSKKRQGKQIWWVDGKTFMRRRVEIYTADEEMPDLTIVFKNYELVDGHWAARRIEMTDILDNLSVIYLREVYFNRPIADGVFFYTLPPGAKLTDVPALLPRR